METKNIVGEDSYWSAVTGDAFQLAKYKREVSHLREKYNSLELLA